METVTKRSALTALDDAGTGPVIPGGSGFEVRGSKFEVVAFVRSWAPTWNLEPITSNRSLYSFYHLR